MLKERQICIGYLIKFIVFTLMCSNISSFKLNSPRILLAYNYGLPSNHTLVISNADSEDCFEWKSGDPHHVIVSPIHSSDGCSQKAIVSVVNSARSRKTTTVTAIHKEKNEVQLHCHVIVDLVKSLQFSLISDEIHIGGPPEILTVVAFDKFGHPFSSINGLQFKWHLTHQIDDSVKSDGNEVARLRRFAESNYSSDVDSNGWEDRGLFGHSVLIEGLNIGSCLVTATHVEAETQETYVLEMKIKVLPTVQVYPSSSLNLLRFGAVNIQAKQDGTEFENKKDYIISVGSTEVVSLSEDSTLATGAEYGSTQLTYKSLNSMFPDMKVDVNVVKPAFIVFRLSRGGFTVLEEMQTYEMSIELLDENRTEIYPSDNLRMMVSFPTNLFYVHSSSQNGTYHIIQTVAPGKGSIRAEYKGLLLPDGSTHKETPLSGSVGVRVCQKLSIFPRHILLPSDSPTRPLHEIPLMASGGTGDYLWASSNISAATIHFTDDKSNVAQLHIHNEADFDVTVTDKNNINFFSSAKISIQPVLDVETYPTVVEAEIGNILILPIAFLAYESKETKVIRKFDDCSKIQPTIEVIEKNVIAYHQEPHIPAFGKGCLSLQFKCIAAGYSRINVFYQPKNGGNHTHKTTTVVACFKPLKPVHPVRVAVLPVGASKEVAFEGGPRKWQLFKTGHYTTMESNKPELVDIELVRDPIRYNRDLTVFRVLCKALGENILTFRIGNHPSATNAHPAKAEGTIKVICSEPHSVHLKLFKKSKRDLLDENIVKVPFYGSKLFAVDVWLKDSMGRKLSNISSLSLEWDVSDETLAVPESSSGFITHENAVAGYRKVFRDFQEFKMTGKAGKLKLSAQVTGYREDFLKKEDISVPVKFQEISSSIDLNLVSLRDINAGLYSTHDEDTQDEVDSCDGDSCKF